MLLTLCPSSVGYAFMNFGDVSVFASPTFHLISLSSDLLLLT